MYQDILINKILENKQLFNYIKQNSTIIGVFVGGSNLFGLADEDSDYDLDVILDDSNYDRIVSLSTLSDAPNVYFKDTKTGKKIHWYYQTVSNITGQKQHHYKFWLAELYFATRSSYENITIKIFDINKYNYFFNTTLPATFKTCIKAIAERYLQLLIDSSVYSDHLFANTFIKDHYHLCLLNCLRKNGALSETDKNNLIILKQYARRNKTRLTSVEYNDFDPNIIAFAKQNLIELLNYFKQEILDA